jgi:hypothetical protein
MKRADWKCTKSIYIHRGETASGMGLHQPRVGLSTRVLRRCIGAKGSLDEWHCGKGDLMKKCGREQGKDVAMMIEPQ